MRLSRSLPVRPLPSRKGWICSKRACAEASASGNWRASAESPRSFWRSPIQLGDRRRNLQPRGRCHALRERLDVVLSKRAGSLPVICLRMRDHIPNRCHRELMDVAQLGNGDEAVIGPLARLYGVSIDRVGGVRVTADLQILAELLVADSAPFRQQCLNLFEDERVALQRGRVVRLLQPDPRQIPYAPRGTAARPVDRAARRSVPPSRSQIACRGGRPRGELFGPGMNKAYRTKPRLFADSDIFCTEQDQPFRDCLPPGSHGWYLHRSRCKSGTHPELKRCATEKSTGPPLNTLAGIRARAHPKVNAGDWRLVDGWCRTTMRRGFRLGRGSAPTGPGAARPLRG